MLSIINKSFILKSLYRCLTQWKSRRVGDLPTLGGPRRHTILQKIPHMGGKRWLSGYYLILGNISEIFSLFHPSDYYAT